LIFDNARRPEDILPFLPAHGSGQTGGHVLITSTNGHWQSLGKVQPVNSWPREESIEFLRERIGGIDDLHAADQLCAALGDLPLALEQAAACMQQADVSIAQYLLDYEGLWAEMLGKGRPVGSYPVYVAMTWELSFRRVETLNPIAAQFLTLCGYFSPDEIPLKMIEDASAELPHELAYGLLDRAARGDALNLLERFSLLKTGDEIVSMHGVISALAQDRLDVRYREDWAAVALRIASRAFPFDSQNPNSWRPCAAVLPHVLSATTHAQSAGVAPHEVVDLLSRVGRFLMKQGSYTESRSLLEMANTLVRTTYGPKSVAAADIANNLARVRHRLGDLAGASALYELALEIDRKNYGPDDPHMATIANNSAMTLVELGKLPQARARFEWAIEVYRKSYVKDHPKIASVMNNLGFVLMQLKEHDAAREWLEKSLTITESTFGANHPQVACIAVNLGGALRAMGQHAAARKLFDRAMLIDETAFGAHHPAVARDLLNLAQLLSDLQSFDEAVRHLERALSITESSFGPEHRETMLCLKELGRALKGAGDVSRAVDCMMKASAILAKPPRMRSNETVVGDEGMLA
jgi:tetratricopeptide (TPR) repeat protein